MTRWLLDFARDGGPAGFVRLEVREDEGVAWYWAYLVEVPGVRGVLAVREHDLAVPRRGLEVRGEGLWAELWCEAPGVHWTFGLEAFGLRLDTPEDALRPGGELGERVPVGLDLEWDAAVAGAPGGAVHGEILVGRARHAFEGTGRFLAGADPDPAAEPPPGAETVATVLVPLGAGHVERRLVRATAGPAWTYAVRP